MALSQSESVLSPVCSPLILARMPRSDWQFVPVGGLATSGGNAFFLLSLYSPHTPDGAASPRRGQHPGQRPRPKFYRLQASPDSTIAPAKTSAIAPLQTAPPSGPKWPDPTTTRWAHSGISPSGWSNPGSVRPGGRTAQPAPQPPSPQVYSPVHGYALTPDRPPAPNRVARDGRGPSPLTGGHSLRDSDYRGPTQHFESRTLTGSAAVVQRRQPKSKQKEWPSGPKRNSRLTPQRR